RKVGSMMSNTSGLDGVIVAETALSDVDGEKGHLVIGGYEVEELAGKITWEKMAYLLWSGRLPSPAELAATRAQLGRARTRAFEIVRPQWAEALRLPSAMSALRALVACLPESTGFEPEGRALIASATVVAATAWGRSRRGLAPLAPDESFSPAEDYLRMLA